MLGNLIRYEFRTSGRLVPFTYIAVVVLALVSVGLAAADLPAAFLVAFILMFLAGAVAIILTYVIVIMRFHKGMYGAEGYLMHTLPADARTLYFSKTVTSFVWMTAATVITVGTWIASGFLLVSVAMRLNPYLVSDSFTWSDLVFYMQTTHLGQLLAGMIVTVLVGQLAFIGYVFFCLTIGNVRPFSKLGLGASVLCYVAIMVVNQIITAFGAAIIPVNIAFSLYDGWYFTPQSWWHAVRGSYFGYAPVFSLNILAVALQLFLAFGLPFITIWLLEHKVNIK